MKGIGILYLTNGQRFEGEFLNGYPNGQGVFYDENGEEILHGYWELGVYNQN